MGAIPNLQEATAHIEKGVGGMEPSGMQQTLNELAI